MSIRIARASGLVSLAEAPAQLTPVHAGQVDVEADDVVRMDAGLHVAVEPVVGGVDGVALAPQPQDDCIGELPLVFHDQHTHGSSRNATHPVVDFRWATLSILLATVEAVLSAL